MIGLRMRLDRIPFTMSMRSGGMLPTPSSCSARPMRMVLTVIAIGRWTATMRAIGTAPASPKAASASGMPMSTVLP